MAILNMKAKLIKINSKERCYTFLFGDEKIYMAFGKKDPDVTLGEIYDIESYEGTRWSETSKPAILWRFKI